MPPRANAELVRVEQQAKPDDWDTAGAPGPVKWQPGGGEPGLPAYYRETLVEVRGNGAVTITTRRELILDVDDVDALELDLNDVLIFRLQDSNGELLEAEHTGRAEAIPRVRLANISRDLQTSRIVLADT